MNMEGWEKEVGIEAGWRGSMYYMDTLHKIERDTPTWLIPNIHTPSLVVSDTYIHTCLKMHSLVCI